MGVFDNLCFYFSLSMKDPTTLLMKLVGQAQEFVVEVKVRLLILLHDNNVDNLAKVFLTGEISVSKCSSNYFLSLQTQAGCNFLN